MCDNVVYERECVTKLCVCDKVVCVTEFVCVCVLFYFCVWVFVFFVSFVFFYAPFLVKSSRALQHFGSASPLTGIF